MSRKRQKRQRANAGPTPLKKPRALAADLTKQVPNNSWGGPVLAYVDTPYICRDCGKEEIWTADQQKWFYEVAKGSLYAKAVQCKACRALIAEQKRIQREQMANGDPRPPRKGANETG